MIDLDYKSKLEDKMSKTISKLKEELTSLKTGRANAGMLDIIKVEVYNSQVPISQLANIVIPEAKTIEIKPWDVSIIGDIERAILKSPLGITPNNDGKIIRLILPAMTEESRKNLVKYINKIEEQYKVIIRNERRDINEELKKREKDKTITQDQLFDAEKDVQVITDNYIKKIEIMIKNKEEEIMTV
ncbi:MAG: ribosome recycling factor [Elusimicrobiota bacterium]|jgi:ribosome recycling factor|nr:ribosome recycling factor [Elusimicrobiota bacterium]